MEQRDLGRLIIDEDPEGFSNPDLDRIVYHIPNSRTLIYARILEQPIEAAALGATIQQAQRMVQDKLASEGDGYLPPVWDPFIADYNWECWILVQSSSKSGPGGVKPPLTLTKLEQTFQGLFNIAYVQGYSQEMNFEISADGLGIVGSGYIKFGSIHNAPVSMDVAVGDALIADA
ncbi:MAG: hypothetical protein Q9216_003404 [Gyalolechia sp. 2 TL-2023]